MYGQLNRPPSNHYTKWRKTWRNNTDGKQQGWESKRAQSRRLTSESQNGLKEKLNNLREARVANRSRRVKNQPQTLKSTTKSCKLVLGVGGVGWAVRLTGDCTVQWALTKTTTTSCSNDIFYCNVLLGTHQDTFVFTLQKTWSQMCPRPLQQVVWVIGSQSIFVVVNTCISSCPLVIRSLKTHFTQHITSERQQTSTERCKWPTESHNNLKARQNDFFVIQIETGLTTERHETNTVAANNQRDVKKNNTWTDQTRPLCWLLISILAVLSPCYCQAIQV